MDLTYHISELRKHQTVFKALFSGVNEYESLWKPSENKWCLLEILCHLYDEEREDFRQRIESILGDPSMPLPPFDPTLWVSERKYLQQDYTEKLSEFLEERTKSIDWLNSLQNPSWDNAYIHPKMGPVSAAFILSNWIAHDYLHVRQILNLKYLYLKQLSGNALDYAGNW